MIKNIIIAVVGVLILVIGYVLLATPTPEQTTALPTPIIYQCSDEKTFESVFTADAASVTLSDGRTMVLAKEELENEIRFVSDDGAFVLWVKDYSAFIEESGTTTYANCVVTPVEFPEIGDQSSI